MSNLTLNTESSDLRVTWTPPTNGRWSGFQIRYRPMFRIQSAVFLVLKTAQSNTSILITDLIPGEGYQVKIAVLSNDLESSEVEAFAVLSKLLVAFSLFSRGTVIHLKLLLYSLSMLT